MPRKTIDWIVNSIFSNENRTQIAILTLTFFYFLTHYKLLFLSEALFFDDWVIINESLASLIDGFKANGVMFHWIAYLHAAIQWSGISYSLATFFCYFLAGLLLYKINRTQLGLDASSAMVISLLFFVLPFNFARVAAINFPYIFCLTVFLIAWVFIRRAFFLSIILFLVSFGTNQLLMLFAVPVLVNAQHFLIQSTKSLKNSVKPFVLILLPFTYWTIEELLFPSNLYTIFDLGTVHNNAYNSIAAATTFIEIEVIKAVSSTQRSLLILLCSLVAVVSLYPKLNLKRASMFDALVLRRSQTISDLANSITTTFEILCFVCLFTIFSTLPYLLTGKILGFDDWNSRHQILFSLSFPFIFLILRGGSFFRDILLCLVFCVLLIPVWWKAYDDFLNDWRKTDSIVNSLSKIKVLPQCDTVVFNDLLPNLNARGRTYRFYELNGMLVELFPEQEKFGLNSFDVGSYFKGELDFSFNRYYRAANHTRTDDNVICTIDVVLSHEEKGARVEARLKEKFGSLVYQSRL